MFLVVCTNSILFSDRLFAVNLLSINSSAKTLIDNDGIKYIEQENGDMELYTGWTKKSNKRFYYKNGKKQKNKWLSQKGVRIYYLTDDGSAATGKVTISGTEYEFDSKGKLVEDEWNIKTETLDVSDTGLKLAITISNDSFKGESGYSSPYTIERLARLGKRCNAKSADNTLLSKNKSRRITQLSVTAVFI